jgi:hypothetical protein
MLDEVNEVAFVMWTAETGNASRQDWNLFEAKDKWERMARAAILRMRVLQLV